MKQVLIHDIATIARHMRVLARSGECRGALTPSELHYIELCRRQVDNTIVLFTIDNYAGCHDWFDAPALQRCHHLSISGATSLERDAWLRAFFGNDLGNVWIESATGQWNDLLHYRQFLDPEWGPIALTDARELELRTLGWRRARFDTCKQYAA